MLLTPELETEFWVWESMALAQMITAQDYKRWQFLHQLRHRERMYVVHHQILKDKICVYTTADWENVPDPVKPFREQVDNKGFYDYTTPEGLTIMVIKEGTWKLES